MRRAAGILLAVSSLPSRYGIGCFSESAYAFVDWLKAAGQTYWQMLPLGPTGWGDSPYQSFSTFAGNPYFISLEALAGEGVLTPEECGSADWGGDPAAIDYEKLYRHRYPLLRRAYARSRADGNAAYRAFVRENRDWLRDYALFMALKDRFGGKPWTDWPEALRLRRADALADCRRELAEDIGFWQFVQWKFFQQYRALKQYANAQGIRIVGDIPIYVAMDSADAWAHPELFELDERLVPTAVAGCPPDGFSPTGQLWGNPLYRWDYHRETGYAWWISRLRACFGLYDVTRIDHFRGFDEYYAIPYGAETAVDGWWSKGPGLDLFRAAEQQLGRHEIIAEDLGFVTDSVRRLVRESGFAGMKVLEFAFDARDTGAANDYLPHNYTENCVAYTGTHDNQTLVSWLAAIRPEERQAVRDYLCDRHTPGEALYRSLIALVMRSTARTCIIPLQDWLGLDDRARMNTPATVGQNWRWRVRADELSAGLRDEILRMTRRYGRMNWD